MIFDWFTLLHLPFDLNLDEEYTAIYIIENLHFILLISR